MTFLQPLLLLALPLAALPVIIHLIHLYRRRRVKWAAMIFLHAAQRMNKGLSRLRQVLILALRVLALLTIILMVARPLSGGWLGLTGGAPDTVLILVDRSASMSQMNTATGANKLAGGLQNIAKAISDAVGTRSHLVLIDSATGKPLSLDRASALTNLPQTEPTDTAADIPGLLQDALDYITTNKTGRTDVWMLSDLQQTDWDASGGRWQNLRVAFAAMPGVRFHLLAYPQPAPDDIGVTIDRVQRRETSDKAELLLDLRIVRHTQNPQPMKLPLSFVVNGAATSTTVDLRENQLVIEGYAIPIDRALKRGWGCVELPADSFPANDKFYFVFDQPPPLRSVIVSDDDTVTARLNAALSAAADPSRQYAAHRPRLQPRGGNSVGRRRAGRVGRAVAEGDRCDREATARLSRRWAHHSLPSARFARRHEDLRHRLGQVAAGAGGQAAGSRLVAHRRRFAGQYTRRLGVAGGQARARTHLRDRR